VCAPGQETIVQELKREQRMHVMDQLVYMMQQVLHRVDATLLMQIYAVHLQEFVMQMNIVMDLVLVQLIYIVQIIPCILLAAA